MEHENIPVREEYDIEAEIERSRNESNRIELTRAQSMWRAKDSGHKLELAQHTKPITWCIKSVLVLKNDGQSNSEK